MLKQCPNTSGILSLHQWNQFPDGVSYKKSSHLLPLSPGLLFVCSAVGVVKTTSREVPQKVVFYFCLSVRSTLSLRISLRVRIMGNFRVPSLHSLFFFFPLTGQCFRSLPTTKSLEQATLEFPVTFHGGIGIDIFRSQIKAPKAPVTTLQTKGFGLHLATGD